MPESFTAHGQVASSVSSSSLVIESKLEMSIIVYLGNQGTYCASNCIAYHDDMSLNMITKARPPFSILPEYFNIWSQTLCEVQCAAMVYPGYEPMDCNNEPSCLQAIVEKEDYDPHVIGQVVYFELASKLEDDG
eukprot:scaffold147848_cov59-Attheya_sp.AAC.1